MNRETGEKIFGVQEDEPMMRIDSRDQFLRFWKQLQDDGLQVQGTTASDPPVAWIEDAHGVVLAKWYHEFGPSSPHEYWVNRVAWEVGG